MTLLGERMNRLLAVLMAVFLTTTGWAAKAPGVEDSTVAIAIAERAIILKYGEAIARMQRPYCVRQIQREDGTSVWIVEGTVPKGSNRVGGIARVMIRKVDGQVLNILIEK